MRHRKKKIVLDRKSQARNQLLKNLITSLVLYEKIKTTKAKAKAMKPIVEKVITIGTINNLNNRRKLLNILYTKKAVKKILEVLSPRYKDRKGGYTRIINLGNRRGDGAKIAQIEFV